MAKLRVIQKGTGYLKKAAYQVSRTNDPGARSLLRVLYDDRKMLLRLSVNDFKTKFAGSHFGILWAFIQPIVTVLVYVLIFGVGFRSGQNMTVPFVVYLVSGIVPWFYCQEVAVAGTSVLLDYHYLVKKVVFEIRILPVMRAISAMFVHLFFVAVAVVVAMLYGIMPSVHIVSLLYYFVAMFLFLLGLIYATSAVAVFFRDMKEVVSIGLQIGIWTVPILFDPMNFSWGERFGWIFLINPMSYIVRGYRDAILYHVWPTAHPFHALYFWIVTLLLLFLGTNVFTRMRAHFADVL